MNGRGSGAALGQVGLTPVMALTRGSAEVGIGLVDGPVAAGHPALAGARIRTLAGTGGCVPAAAGACGHGTFLAGVLVARRDADAPAISPGCTLLVRPIFHEAGADGSPPTAPPHEVGRAIVECVDAGARVVNLSAATGSPTTRVETGLRAALDHAARRGALVVAAAGNQAALGSSEITRHPGVIPVVAYDLAGRPAARSNLGTSLGRRGLGAPGEGVVSLAAEGGAVPGTGTSVAAAIVTGAIALLWSLAPTADAGTLRSALSGRRPRASVVPPLMDARAAYARLLGRHGVT